MGARRGSPLWPRVLESLLEIPSAIAAIVTLAFVAVQFSAVLLLPLATPLEVLGIRVPTRWGLGAPVALAALGTAIYFARRGWRAFVRSHPDTALERFVSQFWDRVLAPVVGVLGQGYLGLVLWLICLLATRFFVQELLGSFLAWLGLPNGHALLRPFVVPVSVVVTVSILVALWWSERHDPLSTRNRRATAAAEAAAKREREAAEKARQATKAELPSGTIAVTVGAGDRSVVEGLSLGALRQVAAVEVTGDGGSSGATPSLAASIPAREGTAARVQPPRRTDLATASDPHRSAPPLPPGLSEKAWRSTSDPFVLLEHALPRLPAQYTCFVLAELTERSWPSWLGRYRDDPRVAGCLAATRAWCFGEATAGDVERAREQARIALGDLCTLVPPPGHLPKDAYVRMILRVSDCVREGLASAVEPKLARDWVALFLDAHGRLDPQAHANIEAWSWGTEKRGPLAEIYGELSWTRYDTLLPRLKQGLAAKLADALRELIPYPWRRSSQWERHGSTVCAGDALLTIAAGRIVEVRAVPWKPEHPKGGWL